MGFYYLMGMEMEGLKDKQGKMFLEDVDTITAITDL
jgi:hypothetical protein